MSLADHNGIARCFNALVQSAPRRVVAWLRLPQSIRPVGVLQLGVTPPKNVLDTIQQIECRVLLPENVVMEITKKPRPEWACTAFCRLDVNDPAAVAEFVLMLCDRLPTPLTLGDYEQVYKFDPIEDMWGWDAPRKRIGKLLWQAVQGDSSEQTFYQRFTYSDVAEDMDRAAAVLGPIQERLKRILKAIQSRREQDLQFGQSEWGEEWWLSCQDADFVRDQLSRARVSLLERSSNFEDMVRRTTGIQVWKIGVLPIPSDDPSRVYVGLVYRPRNIPRITVETTDRTYPLRQVDYLFLEPDGFNFTWGYGGEGPSQLAKCILADATAGDLDLVKDLWPQFANDIIEPYPQTKELRISWREVIAWIEAQGALQKLEDRREVVHKKQKEFAGEFAQREQLIKSFEAEGGLRVQRFDIVPADFECALYVDVMRMCEGGCLALRCAKCELPIAGSPREHGRFNRQRARWERGLPVYHPECSIERGKERKAQSWRNRAKSEAFRKRERQRAKESRKVKA